MELREIKQRTTWKDATENINSNNLKIITEVTKLQGATYKNKGYFKTLADLQSAYPNAGPGSKAYIGVSYPYAIYLWENNSWVDSGATGGEESVNLEQFYTKDETNSRISALENETNIKLAKLSEGKADKNGKYADLTAGDLYGHGESVLAEFTFRASGGKSIKDGRAYIKRIKGNSVVWNNKAKTFQAQDCELSENGNLLTITPQGDFPGVTTATPTSFVIGHKYICVSYRLDGGRLMVNCDGYDGDTNVVFTAQKGQIGAVIYDYYETEQFTITRPIIVDLTQMFQAGNEPTTIEEYNARKPIVADEYAYNEGEVIHMNTESIKSVGDNAVSFEGESVRDTNVSGEQNKKYYQEGKVYVGCEASGYVNPNAVSAYSRYGNGFKVSSTNGYGIGYFVRILPNQEYHISANIVGNGSVQVGWYSEDGMLLGYTWDNNATYKTPSNAQYGLVCLTPVNANDVIFTDIMLTLVHSGWKQDTDAGYQEYWQDTLPLPIIRKYFPDGMKSTGSAHDEIRFNKASGKGEAVQRIGGVDLGTLNWYHDTSLGGFYSDTLVGAKKLFDGLCAKYPFVGDYRNVTDKTCGYVYELCVLVKDSSYTDAASFKAAMQGVILYYELAEPVIREIDEPIGTDYRVADFGTEQAISSFPSAPFSADIIYQFNAVDMIREHELEITELQKVIATMQAQLASLINK